MESNALPQNDPWRATELSCTPKQQPQAAPSAGDRLHALGEEFFRESVACRYSHRFTWLGRPIIQYPQDLMALQEIVWNTRPELIIETGIAHGGSLVFYASMLELLGGGRVLGIDIEIRPANRQAIDDHPLRRRIDLIEGSSLDADVVARVRHQATSADRVMVVLDSHHTHQHVLGELQLYSPLVTKGNYLVVLDTAIERLPASMFADRPWSPGSSPGTAVDEFLRHNRRFERDLSIAQRLVISVAPDGYLRRVTD